MIYQDQGKKEEAVSTVYYVSKRCCSNTKEGKNVADVSVFYKVKVISEVGTIKA